ncbi:MAG: hypothetical protein HY716_03660 [Planctomycetes bacterium]|nr:hypothetical protein [Planctomycetota bacterium]
MGACAAFLLLFTPQAQRIELAGEVGFAGYYRPGDWTSVTIELKNRGPELDLKLLIGWAAPASFQLWKSPTPATAQQRAGPLHEFRFEMPKNSRRRFSAVMISPPHKPLSVWAFAMGRKGSHLATLELRARPLAPQERLLAVAGMERPDGLDLPDLKVAQMRPDLLPEDWRGYASLSALVWAGADPSDLGSGARSDALRTWVSSGGHWIVDAGGAQALMNSPLAGLLPATPERSVPVDDLKPLGSIPGAETSPEGRTLIMDVALRRGAAVLKHGPHPLVVDSIHHGGRVTFLAFDPTLNPFKGWDHAQTFWAWLLGSALDPPPRSTDRRPAPFLVGAPELASAAASFPGVAIPELRKLLILIILFLAVAGPLDYLVLRRLRRLHWTWITFPAYVLIFSAGIVVIGAGFMRSAALQREIAVVDHYGPAGFSRRRAIEAILAPERIAFQTDDARPLSSNFLLQRSGGHDLGDPVEATVLHENGSQLRDWIVPRGATGLAVADECRDGPSPLTYSVEKMETAEARVAIENTMPGGLMRAVLVTPTAIYDVGDVPPGRRVIDAPALAHDLADARGRKPPADPAERSDFGVYCLLERLSFPAAPSAGDPRTGFADGLDARRWVESGGSVLLAWGRDLDPPVSFRPRPRLRRSIVLYRFFQEPSR